MIYIYFFLICWADFSSLTVQIADKGKAVGQEVEVLKNTFIYYYYYMFEFLDMTRVTSITDADVLALPYLRDFVWLLLLSYPYVLFVLTLYQLL